MSSWMFCKLCLWCVWWPFLARSIFPKWFSSHWECVFLAPPAGPARWAHYWGLHATRSAQVKFVPLRAAQYGAIAWQGPAAQQHGAAARCPLLATHGIPPLWLNQPCGRPVSPYIVPIINLTCNVFNLSLCGGLHVHWTREPLLRRWPSWCQCHAARPLRLRRNGQSLTLPTDTVSHRECPLPNWYGHWIGIPIIKIRWSSDHLIFIIEIPKLS